MVQRKYWRTLEGNGTIFRFLCVFFGQQIAFGACSDEATADGRDSHVLTADFATTITMRRVMSAWTLEGQIDLAGARSTRAG